MQHGRASSSLQHYACCSDLPLQSSSNATFTSAAPATTRIIIIITSRSAATNTRVHNNTNRTTHMHHAIAHGPLSLAIRAKERAREALRDTRNTQAPLIPQDTIHYVFYPFIHHPWTRDTPHLPIHSTNYPTLRHTRVHVARRRSDARSRRAFPTPLFRVTAPTERSRARIARNTSRATRTPVSQSSPTRPSRAASRFRARIS